MKQHFFYLVITFFLFSCENAIIEEVVESYPNSQPKLVHYIQEVDGIKEVVGEKGFFENGQTKIEGKLINGKRTGLWKAHFENGFLQSEGEFINGVRTGIAKVYFPDGTLRYEGNYENDKEVGVWKFYNNKGELVKEENF